MSYLLQLAVALVVELELNKSPPASNIPREARLHAEEQVFCKNSPIPETHSLEHMRALTGCFYLSSV
jgi:hypothetical protein